VVFIAHNIFYYSIFIFLIASLSNAFALRVQTGALDSAEHLNPSSAREWDTWEAFSKK